MKKKNPTPHKNSYNKMNIPNNAKGYPIKRVAFHRKVNKHA